MLADTALIDEIVGRVLRELGTTAGDAARAAASPAIPVQAAPSEVSIAAQVVTQEVLSGLTGAIRAIRLAPKAILTPSARDYVRQHGLVVTRATATPTKSAHSRWQVIVSTSSSQVTAALDGLRTAGTEFERRLLGEPREAAAQATNVLCRAEATGVVLLSDQPELVACLANRNERVRAAVLRSIQVLDRLRGSFQPNLLVVDPIDKSQFELRQILKSIVTGGRPSLGNHNSKR